MKKHSFQRVDLSKLTDEHATTKQPVASTSSTSIRWAIIPISVLLCCIQVVINELSSNWMNVALTSTLINVMGFAAFMVLLLLANPMLRLTRVIRPMSKQELVSVFAALLVTAGISTFGLASQLVPLVTAPWNQEWSTPQSGWSSDLHPHMNESLYITDVDAIREYREGILITQDGEHFRRPGDNAPLSVIASYYWQVLIAIPWGLWLKPLAFWMIFIAGCYAIFYCLTYTVLDYWAKNEKLAFPLAKVVETMLPQENDTSWVPRVFRTHQFWITFALSFLIISYRALYDAGVLGPLGPFNLGIGGGAFNGLVQNTMFMGLGGNRGMMFNIIFTAVGISFLLSKEISFSTWFYSVFGMVVILVLVWMGYGNNHNDFPTDWLWVQNPVSAQGAGGILVFSAICLYHAVREHIRLGKGLPLLQRALVAFPVIGLVLSMLVVTGWVYWNMDRSPDTTLWGSAGLLFWAAVFVAFTTLITLGLMRILCESGVYWFQSHASFFHFWKLFGLGQWLAPSVVGPLLPIYSVLFLDIKTFIAPNLANAAKLQSDTKADRRLFHLNLILCITLSVILALFLSIFLAYLDGAQAMNGWFYSSGPKYLMGIAHSAATSSPEPHLANAPWLLFGALWIILTLILRRTFFWFPHPIGYIMMINPLMKSLWFSFFIGWLLKKLTIKYGGKLTYEKFRDAMIGLIMGEIMAIVIWNMLALLLKFNLSSINLNRYGV